MVLWWISSCVDWARDTKPNSAIKSVRTSSCESHKWSTLSITHLINQWTNQSVCESTDQAKTHSMTQSIRKWIKQVSWPSTPSSESVDFHKSFQWAANPIESIPKLIGFNGRAQHILDAAMVKAQSRQDPIRDQPKSLDVFWRPLAFQL